MVEVFKKRTDIGITSKVAYESFNPPTAIDTIHFDSQIDAGVSSSWATPHFSSVNRDEWMEDRREILAPRSDYCIGCSALLERRFEDGIKQKVK